MSRIRVSTTVDKELLTQARQLAHKSTDASLLDEALTALINVYRNSEINASYSSYDQHPLDEPDEWGDLNSFRNAAAKS